MNPTLSSSASTARCDRTLSWAALAGHFQAHGRDFDLREAFRRDPARFDTLSLDAPGLFVDLSKNLLDAATMRFLADLGRECGVEAKRDAMLAGALVNASEGRAVLHTALRAPPGAAPFSAEVHDVLDAVLACAESVRARATGAPGGLCHVVNIGIGGSDLGPQMVTAALAGFAHPHLRFHFVSNVDGADIASVLAGLEPRETLFIVASKTFTTQETMANAETARAWFLARGGAALPGSPKGPVAPSGGSERSERGDPPLIEEHFIAATSNVEAAARFGIATTFGFWDWVGGRYSLWSAIGLPIAIAIGAERFREMLAGAHALDRHFATAPIERNVPMLLGLVDIWYRNFHGFTSRSVAPYAHALKRLPAFLQQLEMESNGKRVDTRGEELPFATSPVVWGEPGTNGQHAYFQMLHQGSDVVPVEFILVRRADETADPALAPRLQAQQRMLLANGLAQAQALMQGRTTEEALAERADPVLAAQRTFPGNRPSTTILLDRLTPRALGALIAMYEHRVFTSGAVWGINSFDQWGVELGKSLSNRLLPMLDAADEPITGASGLDGSTAGLLRRLRAAPG